MIVDVGALGDGRERRFLRLGDVVEVAGEVLTKYLIFGLTDIAPFLNSVPALTIGGTSMPPM